MTTQTEALKSLIHEMEYVLSCINEDKIPFDGDDFHEALRLGKEALAQPEKEPVAWLNPIDGEIYKATDHEQIKWLQGLIPLTTPPQRTWVGLTPDRRIELAQDVDWAAGAYCEYAEKVEVELKVNNA